MRNKCVFCGEKKDQNYEFSQCLVFLMSKPVKDWRTFKKCLNFVCC